VGFNNSNPGVSKLDLPKLKWAALQCQIPSVWGGRNLGIITVEV